MEYRQASRAAVSFLLTTAHQYHRRGRNYNDDFSDDNTLRNLARLWRDSGDASLPGMVAEKLGVSVEETEIGLRKLLENDDK